LIRNILLILILTMLVSWGCRKKPLTIVLPPDTEPTPPAEEPAPEAVTPLIIHHSADLEPSPIAKTITAPSNLELGEMNFQIGHYPQAAKAYEAFLKSNPRSEDCDLALFHLGLSRALAKDSGRNMRQFETSLRRIISEYPKSPFRDQAEFILGLHSQAEKLRSDVKDRDDKIRKLSEELQALKDIDLQRRSSRPKE
jgi:tetratricopeptide (TPR) repeat protein